MKCVKTGAQIYIQELDGMYAADIYAVGPDTLVVRFNERSRHYISLPDAREMGATHFAYQPYGFDMSADWCRDDIGVLVTQRKYVEGELVE